MSRKPKNMENHVSLKDIILWNSSPMSVAITALVLMHVSFYCTNVLEMPTILVGTLFMVSKILDSVTDLIAGFIIDRTQTRWGKGRPYEIFMVFLWLSTWLLFSCPAGFSMAAKSIWVFFMYTFMNSICVTFLDGNNVVYMVRAFKTKEQQSKVTAFGSFITMAAPVYTRRDFSVCEAGIADAVSACAGLGVNFRHIQYTISGLTVKGQNRANFVPIMCQHNFQEKSVPTAPDNPVLNIPTAPPQAPRLPPAVCGNRCGS